MSSTDFTLNVIAALNKQLSKKQLKSDLKTMDNSLSVKILAKLTTALSKRQLKNDLKKLNDLYVQIGANVKVDKSTKSQLQKRIKELQNIISEIDVNLKVSKFKTGSEVESARKAIQAKVNKTPIGFDIEVKRSKAIADIEYLGKRFSKLFTNVAAKQKYENILMSAYSISDENQLRSVRNQIAAFTSELKANGLASQSLGDKWRSLIERSKNLFSAASIVTTIFIQVKQAVSTFLQLDTAMTNLYKVQNQITSRDQFSGLLTKWNKLAQNLAVTTESLISSMEAWSKIGFDLDMSEQLAEITSIFEKTAEISNEKATSTLISAAQAFTEIDGLGVDDYIKRVEAVGNKINAIGNKYAINSEGIADGLQNASAALKVAGNDLNETISLITTTNKIYQNPEEGSNMLKIASMRLRGQVDALKEMGEDAEGVSTDLTKIQQQVYELTGNKVNIFENDNTMKSTYQMVLEIGKVFDSLSDRSQADLLEVMFGKQRASAGASLLLNWEELEKIKNDSINAGNSMAQEYAKYMESAKAHITIFKEKLVETYSTFMSGNLIKYTADLGSGILDLVNSTDLLRHGLVGIISLNIGKGITSVGVSIAYTAKQFNTLGSALQQVKNLPVDEALRVDALEEIGNTTKSLTEKNLKLLLSQKQLKDSDREMILSMHNLTDEEVQLKLQKMGLIATTKAQSTANVEEAATTSTLKSAMLSLKASVSEVGVTIKGMFVSNPIGMWLMVISTAFSMLTTAITKHNEKLEETRRANIDAATTASENADKLKDLYNEYNRLSSIQDRTISEEEAFKTAVGNITIALGSKAEILKDLTAGTDEYADALARVTKEELQSQAVTATIGRKSAEEELQGEIWSDWKGSKVSINSNNKGKSLSSEAQKAVAIVSESLKEYETVNRKWGNISWDISSDDPTEALEFYNSLVEAREKLVSASKDNETLLDTEIYEDLNTAINTMSESLDTYIEKLYEEEKLNYMAQNGIPRITEEYKAMEAALTDAAGSSADLQERFKELLTADFTSLATGIEEVGDAVRSLNDTPVSFSIADHKEQIDSIKSSISTLRSALDSFNSGTLDESAVLDLMQQFPELIPYVDLAADGFGNLSEGLSVLIAQQPESLIQSLEALKESLNTEEERVQVDALINSLQSLSSYGDTGIEAYATSIGSTWTDTANVIQSVTTQFENLAKVQEAVADGLTISTSAAVELAKIYPEILTNAIYAGSGQIQLNEDVVKSILAGDQSIINAQITKLEADEAELEARKETAIAELEIANQVGTAKGQIDEETAKNKIELLNQELENEISKNNQVGQSYAQTVEGMAQNTEQLGNYEAEVADNTAVNWGNSTASMADNMKVNSEASQQSLSGIMMKAADAALAVANIATGKTVGNPNAIYSGKSGKNIGGIKKVSSPSKFTSTVSDFVKGNLSLNEFKSGLEIDIQGYEQAISNIDSQIEVLKNLQATFADTANSANGGIGGHNYADKIKDLEKEKDKINNALNDSKSGSGSSEETKDEYEELFDFFERRVKVLDNALSLLKTNLDNVTGSFAKNNLIDAELGITEEKFKNYSDALNMYTQKANEALSKLPSDLAVMVKDGAVDLSTFIGDGNKEVVEAIKDYEQWADKVNDCKQELAELRTAIRQLELEKFNNIVEEFSNQFDLHEDGKDLISKQIDLLKEAGQLLGESFFTAQIDQSKKQLELLEAEKMKLVEQMTSAIGSGRVQKGTDEWLEMVGALSNVEGNILDCKKAIEEFDNELLQLHWDVFDRIQGQFKDLDSELSNLRGLFDDSKVTNDNFNWSKEGLAQLGLLTQQYELAQYQVQQYNDEINQLSKDYLAGRYSAIEYADKLSELSSAQWDAVNSSESIKDAIIELNEVRIDEEIDTIEKEIDAYKELIDAQIDALKASKDLHDYQQSIAEKTKSVTDLERQIAAMQNDNTAATVAKRKQLEEQLAQARKELEDAEYDHSIEAQEEALNKQYDDYKAERDKEIEALKASLEERETLIAESFETVKANADVVGQEIALIATQHGVTVSDAIITSWQNGETAIASYGQVLSEGTSAFIGNIMDVENEVYALQYKANETADSLAWMFSTRADNLVNELASSYYSEENLNYMTQALHDSLINTLEGGYNISSIQSALDGIASGLNNVASAANNATNAMAAMGAAQATVNSGSSFNGDFDGGSGKRYYNTNTTKLPETVKGNVKFYTPKHTAFYAKGTKNAKGGLRVINEEGQELTLPKLSSGNYTIGNEGDQILTKEQTDNIQEWSRITPEEFAAMYGVKPIDFSRLTESAYYNIPSLVRQTNPEIVPNNINNNSNINVHYDSLVTVNGDVNDTKHFLNDMKNVANDAIKKSWHDFEMTRKYGIY